MLLGVCMCPWICVPGMCLCVCVSVCVPGCTSLDVSLYMCPWNVYLVCVSLDMFLWFARAVFSSLCLVSTLKNDQSKCNEAYQTPVTSNIRLISSQVTR